MIGLQQFAYDVLDEGPDRCVAGAELVRARLLLLCVNHWDAVLPMQPGRIRMLSHNPNRSQHAHGACFGPVSAAYPKNLPPAAEDGQADGHAAWTALAPLAEERGIAVVPWVHVLTQYAAVASPSSALRNARGQLVPGWLCPSRPEVAEYSRALVSDVLRTLSPAAIFIDRIRFPDWGLNGFVDSCSCFCDTCSEAAASRGIDVEAVRARLLDFADLLDADPFEAGSRATEIFGAGALSAAAGNPLLLGWLRFRQVQVESLLREISDEARGRADVWLDVWPPSWAGLLGQDLASLAAYAAWVKPMVYHRRSGGSDVPGFILSTSSDSAAREAVYQGFRAFFGFQGPDRLEGFVAEGLDPAFITTELERARRALGRKSKLAAGVELYGCGAEGVAVALDHAQAARPDGLFLNNFATATLDELAAVGDWVERTATG